MAFLHRHRWVTPYLLLLPGLAFLAVFFLIPTYYLANTSLQSGDLFSGYVFSWAWDNYSDAVTTYQAQFLRSLEYAGLATAIAFLISYPLAYWIAFRHLPHPDDRLEDDPRRRGLRRPDVAEPAPAQ
jgi:spermidine/putrescine transport system permease protein